MVDLPEKIEIFNSNLAKCALSQENKVCKKIHLLTFWKKIGKNKDYCPLINHGS